MVKKVIQENTLRIVKKDKSIQKLKKEEKELNNRITELEKHFASQQWAA